MISYFKKKLNKAKTAYENKSLQILKYLDRELNYEQSLKHYTDQHKIKELTMEYKSYKFENEIHSLSSMPETAIEEVIDINIYIAQMNKVQINARKANFFVVTDSEDILLKLNDVFNWMNKIFYIIPNTYDHHIDKQYRNSINFHCLKHLEKHVSTPESLHMNMLKEIGGIQVTVPNQNRVFCFNSKRLVPGS